jgi:hypothetical protein
VLSPCAIDLGEGGEGSVNSWLYSSLLEEHEHLAVAPCPIYRHGGPVIDPRLRGGLLTHGNHIRKRHSEVNQSMCDSAARAH